MRKRARMTTAAVAAVQATTLLLAGRAVADDVPATASVPGPVVRGAIVRPEENRASRACSTRHPVCVQGRGVSGASLLAVLASADAAWDVLTGALELPAPDADTDTGAYDVYVVPGVLGALTAASSRDPLSRIDRASAFTLLDASLAAAGGCALDTAVASAVARAALFRASPATDAGSAVAESAYFARLAVPCAMTAPDGVEVFQSHAERAVPDTWVMDPHDGARYDRGASLFYWWLDATYGASPGSLVRALWSLSATSTPPGAERWNDEPDGWDVLRTSFKDALSGGSKVEDLYAEFGTSRALLGSRENGLELPEARSLGALLAPRIDWEIDWPAKPRRLASPVPIAATGSSYVLVHHAGARPGARLRVEAAWEQHAAIRWWVVKLDAQGRETGRVVVGAQPRATEAQMTVIDLDATADVLLAATNVGDPYAPMDPDDETFEPHAWLLTLAEE
jgi:hypothetical protein